MFREKSRTKETGSTAAQTPAAGWDRPLGKTDRRASREKLVYHKTYGSKRIFLKASLGRCLWGAPATWRSSPTPGPTACALPIYYVL